MSKAQYIEVFVMTTRGEITVVAWYHPAVQTTWHGPGCGDEIEIESVTLFVPGDTVGQKTELMPYERTVTHAAIREKAKEEVEEAKLDRALSRMED